MVQYNYKDSMEKTTTRNKYPEVSEEISAGRQFAKAARR
jgi:hypothetical protein